MNILVALFPENIDCRLVEYFEKNGYNVIRTNTIEETRRSLELNPPDCLLIDLTSLTEDGLDPVKAEGRDYFFTGWEFVQKEVLPEYPNLKGRIVFYSGHLKSFARNIPDASKEGVIMIDMYPPNGGGGKVKDTVNSIARELARQTKAV